MDRLLPQRAHNGFFIKIAGPAENDVKFNLKMDSGVKFDAESDVAHQLLEKGAQRAHFGPVKSQFKP